MIRKFAALPIILTYRCSSCKAIFGAEKLPELCPSCKKDLKEVGATNVMDDIKT